MRRTTRELIVEITEAHKLERILMLLPSRGDVFIALQQLVTEQALPAGLTDVLLDAWEDESRPEQNTPGWRWLLALLALCWSAEQAQNILVTQTNLRAPEQMPRPERPRELKEFDAHKLWDWCRILSGASGLSAAVEVPVALVDRSGKGLIATLSLGTIDDGDGVTRAGSVATGRAIQHPLDALAEPHAESFVRSMSNAWAWAALLGCGRRACDGYWRLLKDATPFAAPEVFSAGGASAGGAAYVGWYHALCGTLPDGELIVLAEMDVSGGLSPVNGVSAKAEAIALDGRFDTIVVADDTNEREAVAALSRLGKLATIKVRKVGDMEDRSHFLN